MSLVSSHIEGALPIPFLLTPRAPSCAGLSKSQSTQFHAHLRGVPGELRPWAFMPECVKRDPASVAFRANATILLLTRDKHSSHFPVQHAAGTKAVLQWVGRAVITPAFVIPGDLGVAVEGT